MLSILHHAASIYHSVTHLTHTMSDAHEEMTTEHPSAIFNRCVETVEALRLKLPPEIAEPKVAIVCGSGLGGLVQCLNTTGPRVEVKYEDVVGFPRTSGECIYKRELRTEGT